MFDVVIVGGGPAGLNAALVLGRARRRVLVLDTASGRNITAESAHNVLYRDGVPPAQLREAGLAELRHYPSVEFRPVGVTDITGKAGNFRVNLANCTREKAHYVLLATGMVDVLPDIKGLRPLWGRSVLYCPYCHGWEVREQSLAVLLDTLRNRDGHVRADEERQEQVHPRPEEEGLIASCGGVLLATRLAVGFSDDVVACTNGQDTLHKEQYRLLSRVNVTLRKEQISRLEAHGNGLRIVFHDGTALDRRALFVHPPLRQRSTLAKRLGCRLLDDEAVEVDDLQQTSVPGVFAAGDMARRQAMPTIGGQIGIAAAEGITAAVVIDLKHAFAPFL